MASPKLARFVARASMALGLAVGVASVVVWNFGFRIEPTTPWIVRVAVAKFGLAMAATMVFSGALVLRSLKQWERRRAERARAAAPNGAQRALGTPSWAPEWPLREQEPQRITTPPEAHTP